MSKIPLLSADKASAVLCKRHLWYFVQEFWDTIVPNPLVWNWHMQVLCDEIQASDERVFQRLPKLHDIIINISPGTSKTKIVSILSTAWEFARMPSIKVFVGSYSDAAVTGFSDEIRLVMKSDKYRSFFPATMIRRDRDTLHEFKTEANGHFFAFTVGGSITSKHADILKVDDPLNPKESASAATLESTNAFFDKVLPTRKVDKEVTPTYLIMQRLAANDPTGHLLEKKGEHIHHICLPATLGKQVKPEKYKEFYMNGYMDPVRLGAEVLKEMKIDLGAQSYAGQFEQLPVPEGGLIWQKWFIEVPDEQFPDPEDALSYGTDWDLAYTREEENAASAYVCSGKIGGKVYLFDYDWKWLEFPELIKWMKKVGGPHYIEAKASGKSTKQTLSSQGVIALEIPVKGGSDKIARAKMATPMAEAGLVYIRKSMAERLYHDSKQGILFFPKGQYKDLADALAQALQRHSNRGVRVLVEEEGEEDVYEELEKSFAKETKKTDLKIYDSLSDMFDEAWQD